MIPEKFVIYLEILGYIGTALVFISMMMNSVVKLRVFNICGSVISAVYAVLTVTYPVALLNLGLIIINIIQIVRHYKAKRSLKYIRANADDEIIAIFKEHYKQDLADFFPNARIEGEIFVVYSGVLAVGLFAGTATGDVMDVHVDYAAPGFRNYAMASLLFPIVRSMGIKEVYTDIAANRSHASYLKGMGFREKDGRMYKKLS